MFSRRVARSLPSIVVGILGETRAWALRNVNCTGSVVATPLRDVATAAPPRSYNGSKVVVGRVWVVGFTVSESGVAKSGVEDVPTYLFRILPAYICINSAQARWHSHRVLANPQTYVPVETLVRLTWSFETVGLRSSPGPHSAAPSASRRS